MHGPATLKLMYGYLKILPYGLFLPFIHVTYTVVGVDKDSTTNCKMVYDLLNNALFELNWRRFVVISLPGDLQT